MKPFSKGERFHMLDFTGQLLNIERKSLCAMA